jgi:hypothetical protein
MYGIALEIPDPGKMIRISDKRISIADENQQTEQNREKMD